MNTILLSLKSKLCTPEAPKIHFFPLSHRSKSTAPNCDEEPIILVWSSTTDHLYARSFSPDTLCFFVWKWAVHLWKNRNLVFSRQTNIYISFHVYHRFFGVSACSDRKSIWLIQVLFSPNEKAWKFVLQSFLDFS